MKNASICAASPSKVIGAHFEKLGSTSFPVYSIAVTDADNNTWSVKRRSRFCFQFFKNYFDG